jgi:hypothetical protein
VQEFPTITLRAKLPFAVAAMAAEEANKTESAAAAAKAYLDML